MTSIAGLLLAAGAGRRMGLPKGLVRDPDGTAWVTRSARVLAEGGCDPVVVVVGARGDEVAALVPSGALVVVAPGWAEGMGASLRAGLHALAGLPAPAGPPDPAGTAGTAGTARTAGPGGAAAPVGAVVGLVDTPGVTPDVVRLLVARALPAGPGGLARAAYRGVPGHPVVLGRDHWAPAAATARGDSGARAYLAGRDVVLVECSDVGDGRDVDEPPHP